MRWFAALSVAVIAFALPATAAEIETQSKIDSVAVDPDGATVTRLIRVDLSTGDNTVIARDFPLSLDPSSLRVEGRGDAQFTIGSIDARPPRPAPPPNLSEIDQRIQDLRDQREALDGLIAAATARRDFAERFAKDAPAALGDEGKARPLDEWRRAFAAVAEEVAAADAQIRQAKYKQRDIDREIARLEDQRNAKPPRKLQVRIELSATVAASALLRITYAVRGARWRPLYDARLDSGGKDRKPSLELVRRAEITQATGEDWTDVALTVSTVRTARGGNAPDLNPLIVRFPPQISSRLFPREEAAAPPARGTAKTVTAAPQFKADEQEADAEIGAFQVVFRVPGRVSIPAGSGPKNLRLATATVAPELTVRTTPVLDQTAYLQAAFKQEEDAPLLAGQVSLYRDNVFVGRSRLAATAKDETVRLGFGADERVTVERAVLKQAQGTSGFIVGTSKTDERAFKITVRNGHDIPIKVAVEDQMPVSEDEQIEVELLSSTTPPTTQDLSDRRGVLEWVFEAKPGEEKVITLAWRLSWPKDKSVIFNRPLR